MFKTFRRRQKVRREPRSFVNTLQMLSAKALLATRGKTPGNKMVEGENSRPARDNDEKACRPDAVGRPGIGIDENFDDRGHAEKGQRGQAAGEPYN